MGVRRVVASLALVVTLGTGVAQASDWIGDRYGWRYYGGLQSTVDGGKHWKTMASFGYLAPDYVHLTPRGGFVFPLLADDEGGGMPPYWTIDDGAHWYRASLSGLPDPPAPDWHQETYDIQGNGRHLFYAVSSPDDDPTFLDLYEVGAWPPTRKSLACPYWHSRRSIGLFGRVCDAPWHILGGTRVAHVEGWLLDRLANAPGGIVALALRKPERTYAVVTYRYGHRRVIDLPVTAATRLPQYPDTAQLRVDWPEIHVVVGDSTTSVQWRSLDGGDDWQQY
jgi:hypothetical protein